MVQRTFEGTTPSADTLAFLEGSQWAGHPICRPAGGKSPGVWARVPRLHLGHQGHCLPFDRARRRRTPALLGMNILQQVLPASQKTPQGLPLPSWKQLSEEPPCAAELWWAWQELRGQPACQPFPWPQFESVVPDDKPWLLSPVTIPCPQA